MTHPDFDRLRNDFLERHGVLNSGDTGDERDFAFEAEGLRVVIGPGHVNESAAFSIVIELQPIIEDDPITTAKTLLMTAQLNFLSLMQHEWSVAIDHGGMLVLMRGMNAGATDVDRLEAAISEGLERSLGLRTLLHGQTHRAASSDRAPPQSAVALRV